MRTKNKMDSNAESKEWWEVVEEYFTKELEKNLALHRVDEIFLRYKLEASQKNFPIFICGNPTNTKVSSQDEETETRPSGTTQEEEVQTKESQDLKVEQLKRRSYN
jgi:peptide subunit release factor 1 (eRF1)